MSPTGPLFPSTAVDGGGVNVAWTNPANAKVSDGVYAVSSWAPGQISNYLQTTGYGFSIPSYATIDGIYVEFQRLGSNAGTLNVSIMKAGAQAGTIKAGTDTWPGSEAYTGYGGATDLWGLTWTPADINNSGFGAAIQALNTHGGGSGSIDAVRITVYWHASPTDVPKRYDYKVFNSGGQYLGNLPNVISEYAHSQDINTAGSQITIEVGTSIDVSRTAVDTYTDESGTPYTDEAGATNYTTEGAIPIVSPGNSGYDTLIKNGNMIQVVEYGYYYPNGKSMFLGMINRHEASFGGDNDTNTIKLVVYSDGSDLDNYIARGAPFTYTNDQSQTSQNAFDTIQQVRSTYIQDGQSFKVGAAVTNVGAITVMLNGTANVTLSLWDSSSQTTLLGTTTVAVSVGSATAIQFGFTAPIKVNSGSTYFFNIAVDDGQSILIYYQNTDVYVGGNRYTANYGGGGGGSFGADTGDLYFITGSSTGSTTGTYTTVDPTTGMLNPIVTDYNSRGGLIKTTASSVDATGLSLTYTFNVQTIYEAIKAILTLAPNGFYYYVDLGTDTLYFKNASTTADIVLTKGKNVSGLNLITTIENVKNQVLFTGGPTAGVNLYKQYQSSSSIALYGVRLDRKSDNRVTVAATADAIGQSEIAELKGEQSQSTVTVLDTKTMDITLLKPGQIVGFNGYGTYVDSLLLQIVRVDYSPQVATLTLGILPKRLLPAIEQVTRDLVAQQTIANPSAPS